MLRVRFKANLNDPRPVHWPIKHPYWVTGQDNEASFIVAYADDEQYIFDNWPEATELDIEVVTEYIFTERFPRPGWFKEE